jgi:hypothetical protein
MATDFSINFPSDLSKPRETMLTFSGTAKLQPKNEQKYENHIYYTLRRAEKRPSGDPSAVRIDPSFTGVAERLYKFFDTKYPGALVSLGDEASRTTGTATGEISYEVSANSGWVFAPTVFELLDAAKMTIAEIELPAFAPQ